MVSRLQGRNKDAQFTAARKQSRGTVTERKESGTRQTEATPPHPAQITQKCAPPSPRWIPKPITLTLHPNHQAYLTSLIYIYIPYICIYNPHIYVYIIHTYIYICAYIIHIYQVQWLGWHINLILSIVFSRFCFSSKLANAPCPEKVWKRLNSTCFSKVQASHRHTHSFLVDSQ